jgi:hypothetical protein
VVAAAPAPKPAVKQAAPAAKPEPGIQILSPAEAQRVDLPQVAEEPEQSPETILAALPARSVPLPVLAPRPQADVAPTVVGAAEPENLPFGMAQPPLPEAAPAAEESQVAVNIPLPTRRPDYAPPRELAAPAEEKAILLALAEPQAEKPTMADVASLPLPQGRPDTLDRETVVAALPDAPSALPETARPEHLTEAAAVEAEMKAGSERVAALAVSNATPREAVVQRAPGSDPVAAMGTGVKTTRKAARASAGDTKPDRKPVVVAAQPQAARWVLHTDYVKNASAGTTAPSFAYNLVRTAPREVYTAGFQAGDQMADANRFSGKAVEFLSVARF